MTDKILRVRIAGKEPAVRAFLREVPLDSACAGPRRRTDGELEFEAYVSEAQLERVRQAGFAVDVIEDATETGRARQQEVGRGNRFADKSVPRGLGRKVKGPQ